MRPELGGLSHQGNREPCRGQPAYGVLDLYDAHPTSRAAPDPFPPAKSRFCAEANLCREALIDIICIMHLYSNALSLFVCYSIWNILASKSGTRKKAKRSYL